MSQAARKRAQTDEEREPTWGIAALFPSQGTWSEAEYLDLDTNILIEFSDGYLEFPPMPTTSHQRILLYLYGLLLAHIHVHDLGEVSVAALPVRLWARKFREPDVVFMLKEHADRIDDRFWKGANLVMEVVNGDKKDRHRDLVDKRREYARARIPEYWIVDPEKEKITVLRLTGKTYAVHGEFTRGAVATSHLLPGFTVDVTAALVQQLPSKARKPRRKPKPKGR